MFETYPKQCAFNPKLLLFNYLFFEKVVFPSVNQTKFANFFFLKNLQIFDITKLFKIT